VDPAAVRTEYDAVVERGSTVLLYTDGLVERRDQGFDDGIELLGRALAEEADRPLEDVCDGLLRRLIPDGAEDDVALVAVRLLPRAKHPAGR
jgi:serine phosphatase RsbU (regulator of sigma subunit)